MGRIESFQFLGLGRLDVARDLCPRGDVQPVGFDDEHALVQLSFMKWNASPVGPYYAAFVGLVLAPRGRIALPPVRPSRVPSPRAAPVLSAFLRAPRLLLVTNYTVGDSPEGPTGNGRASQQFGHDALDMHKNEGRFVATRRDGVTHLQALEVHLGDTGQTFMTGFSISTSVGPDISTTSRAARLVRSPRRFPLSPSLLPCVPLLAAAMARSVREDGAQSGALLVPARGRPGQLSCIATRFTTRPRLRDLTSDGKLAFTPMVLERPAPENALGRILERLRFVPFISMWDPSMTGSILGPVARFEDALA